MTLKDEYRLWAQICEQARRLEFRPGDQDRLPAWFARETVAMFLPRGGFQDFRSAE
jgi:hypothetical protein